MTSHNNLSQVIELNDIKNIWQHLEKTFGLDVEIYQHHFRKYVEAAGDNADVAECFIHFGTNSIEPVLNEMLRRSADYPTWTNLLRFFLKEKLAATSEQRSYYLSGAWKTMRVDQAEHAGFSKDLFLQ